MGHSMGGKTAMRFALDFPKRVERLIIVDMAPRAYDAVHEDIFKALLALDLASFKDRRQMDDALEPSIPEARLRSFLLKGLRHDASGAWRWRFNLSDLHRNYARLNGAIHAAQPFVKPALFVRGGESDHVCERDYPEITRLFPNVEIAEIPGAGHWVHAEAPGPFLEIVRNFLSKKIVDRKIIFPA
jgi:pimeloyl-ACP methyl ester carboxylesterase